MKIINESNEPIKEGMVSKFTAKQVLSKFFDQERFNDAVDEYIEVNSTKENLIAKKVAATKVIDELVDRMCNGDDFEAEIEDALNFILDENDDMDRAISRFFGMGSAVKAYLTKQKNVYLATLKNEKSKE